MKKRISALMLAAFGLATATSAMAQTNLRQLNQERRIDAGVRSGKLAPGEAATLRGQQHAIEHQSSRMRARHGGHLTAYDKRVIHARQARANRLILAKKHNRIRGKDHLPL
ncbi:MAG TPA: hypothetical protein VGC10_00580 [Sphingomonas sp.]